MFAEFLSPEQIERLEAETIGSLLKAGNGVFIVAVLSQTGDKKTLLIDALFDTELTIDAMKPCVIAVVKLHSDNRYVTFDITALNAKLLGDSRALKGRNWLRFCIEELLPVLLRVISNCMFV